MGAPTVNLVATTAVRRLDGRHLVVGSTLLTQALLVVSGPLAIRLLGLEGRGEVAFVFAAVLLLGQVAHGGIPQAWAYAIARDAVSPAALLRARLGRFTARSVIVAALGAAGIAVLASVQEPLSDPVAELAVSAVAVVAVMHAVLALSVLQGAQRFGHLAAVQLLPGVLYTGGLVVMLLTDSAGIVAVLVVYFASWGVVAAWGLAVGRRSRAGAPPPRQSALRAYGRRALVAASAPIDNLGVDQLLVAALLLHTGLGAYTVALAFETAPVLLLHAIGMVAMPGVAALTDPAAQRRYAMRWIGVGLLLAILGVALIQLVMEPVMRFAFGAEAMVALDPARVLVVAGILLGLRRLTAALLNGLGRPAAATAAEIAGFAVMVAGMLVLVPWLGLVGACWAMLAAGAVTATWGLVVLAQHTRTPAPPASAAPSAPR